MGTNEKKSDMGGPARIGVNDMNAGCAGCATVGMCELPVPGLLRMSDESVFWCSLAVRLRWGRGRLNVVLRLDMQV